MIEAHCEGKRLLVRKKAYRFYTTRWIPSARCSRELYASTAESGSRRSSRYSADSPPLQRVSKKALAGLPGGDLGKAGAACPAALLSHTANGIFSYVLACLLVAPEESFATARCVPLMPRLAARAATRRPCLFLVSADAYLSPGAG